MIFNTQSINIEDVPSELRSHIDDLSDRNGGNILSIYDEDSPFSKWLVSIGFEFNRGPKWERWDWLTIYR